MSEYNFTEFDSLADDGDAVFARLARYLQQQQDYQGLFDALVMHRKHELGLPLGRPGSLEDVPEEHQPAIEEAMLNATRVVGYGLLRAGRITEAWAYLRTINERDAVRQAIEASGIETANADQVEQLIKVLLHEGAHPPKGLELLLRTRGMSETISATEQSFAEMSDGDRKHVAAMLVNAVHAEFRNGVSDAEHDNDHVDSSHLRAVVRFSRSLDASCPELSLAIELAQYGLALGDPVDESSEPPFVKFYEGHLHYLRVLAGQDADQSLEWFQMGLTAAADLQEQQLIARVLVDLLERVGKSTAAVQLAGHYLSEVNDPQGFSFLAMCHESHAFDQLKSSATERGDVLAYVSAVLAEGREERLRGVLPPVKDGAVGSESTPRTDTESEASYLDHNRDAYNTIAENQGVLATPATDEQVQNYRETIDSRGWLPESIEGLKVLCLACGGGWQSILYARGGADVTVVDLSPSMLAIDEREATRRGLSVRLVQSSMEDLSMFDDGVFDIVHQAVSTCYVPSITAVYEQVARVLRDDGLYISTHKQPASLQITHRNKRNRFVLGLEYYREGPLPQTDDTTYRENGAVEYLHRLEEIVGGLCEAGFVIEGMGEPMRADPTAPITHFGYRGRFIPPYVRLKARRVRRDNR